jgi:hypothetical protein
MERSWLQKEPVLGPIQSQFETSFSLAPLEQNNSVQEFSAARPLGSIGFIQESSGESPLGEEMVIGKVLTAEVDLSTPLVLEFNEITSLMAISGVGIITIMVLSVVVAAKAFFNKNGQDLTQDHFNRS